LYKAPYFSSKASVRTEDQKVVKVNLRTVSKLEARPKIADLLLSVKLESIRS